MQTIRSIMSEAEARKKASRVLDAPSGEGITVMFSENGWNGPGWYCWETDYPEDGTEFLGV